MISFKGMRNTADIIMTAVRWYISYQLSYRDVQEMLAERGVHVHHSSVFRWVIKYVPLLEKRFREHKKPVGRSWRMDETYVQVNGKQKYLYRAVDKEGNTVEFLLTARRNAKAALRYLRKAMKTSGRPQKITIDKSAASTAAIKTHNRESHSRVHMRRVKYLNNIVEQDHRPVKRKMRSMMGFKKFRTARITIAGIELVNMLRKGQMRSPDGESVGWVEQFFSLAFAT
jgi:transposase-like protein